jgi:hypothetical protein
MAIGFSALVATKFPAGGHLFSPLVAIESPHQQGCDRGSVQGHDSFAGGGLGEPVAVLPVGDQDVRVMQEPLDRRGGEAFGHQLIKPNCSWHRFGGGG